jgi:hypothetical protein
MIILALILAIQTDWRDALPGMGWTYAAASTEAVLFIKPGPRPNLRWQRQEYRVATSIGVRSTMSLVEVDCPGGRSRFIQGTYYSQPNLEGRPLHSDNEAEGWSYPLPDTIGARFFKVACE